MEILIADADEEARLALFEAIVGLLPDARVREATNGFELRAAIADASPDILFIDTILPDTSAEMVMTWRDGVGARSVVVFVADLLTARWPAIARRLNAYDVLLKPLDQRKVSHVLQAAAFLGRDLTLLLVEPGLKTRHITRQILDSASFRFQVTEAEDGRGAIRKAAARRFDLALIGPSIPDMPPSEVACRIDALETGVRMAMVVRPKDDQQAAKITLFGATTVLHLPFSSTDIDRLVYETFGLWRPYLLGVIPHGAPPPEKARSGVSVLK